MIMSESFYKIYRHVEFAAAMISFSCFFATFLFIMFAFPISVIKGMSLYALPVVFILAMVHVISVAYVFWANFIYNIPEWITMPILMLSASYGFKEMIKIK